MGDDLTTLLTSWRPRDVTSTAEGTCGGEGRHGEGKEEEWRPVTSAELEIVVDGSDEFHEWMEAAAEFWGDWEGDQGVELPLQEDLLQRPRPPPQV